ncbi:MAG: RDD family protein [Cellvibrio sp.]|uniref:RDD family protein n=1 Tax=Cellvibrio sp. TaxID=1965322 RepID=UPI0031B3A9F8
MSDNNVYSTPQSQLVDQVAVGDAPLASRWARLGASIIDSIIMMVILLPVMYLTGGFDGVMEGVQPGFVYTLGMGVLGLVVFFVINYRFLIATGQTVGKKVLEIKIVDLNGNVPVFQPQLLIRYAVYMLPGQIPVVGQLFSLVNILFIFGKEKRCVHDILAKTKVVKC